ncbi:hypothetical protein ACFL4G_11210 [Thermodesulfobacteriota bacterium]
MKHRTWCTIFVLLIFVIACIAEGCMAMKPRVSKLVLVCDPKINEGNLLAVDVIPVDAKTMDIVLEIGPDEWFESTVRDELKENIVELALRGGEDRKIPSSKWPKGTTSIIIYALFSYQTNPEAKQVVIDTKRFAFKRGKIKVENDRVVVE